jgi:transcriptional regulator with XRE-family HTH domain
MGFYQRTKPPSILKITYTLRRLLQSEIAHKIGVSQSWISHLDLGKERPSRVLRKRLSRVLGLPAAVLFPEDGR